MPTDLLDRQGATAPLADLTERERAVLSLMAEGRTNLAISRALFLNAKTVEAHIRRIFTKMGLLPAAEDNRRVLAVVSYLRAGEGRS